MHWTDRREAYRAVIGGTECIHPGSVFDAMSARIAEDLGFEVGMFAGSTASLTVLGAPDLIVLTLSEFAAQAYRINRAGKLPLMVDADHGYGNALTVMRTVQELETAGVAGMMVEDTILPRTFGEKKPGLIAIEEGIGKMRAALRAREISGGSELTIDRDRDKNPVVALREIAEEKADLPSLEADLIKSLQRAPEPEPAEEEVIDLIATDENIFGIMDVQEEALPDAGAEDMAPDDLEAAIAAELGGKR